ncbi:MAG: hypothetical protein BWY69_01056 [Planctomycetes bacterium ADurb.Bin401]|nr:MAG: hypothetical protein BWY69_01056 [Planctomycetes bacterium ADurb.Bin401]
MKSEAVIKLYNESSGKPYRGEIVRFETKIFGKTLDFSINVTGQEATLSDIVPAARKISDKIICAIMQGLNEDGINVPCRKGCCSCCSSLIPMPIPEVFRMREELLSMPNKSSNRILRRSINSAVRILKKTNRSEYLKDFSKPGKNSLNDLNKWYGELHEVCPLLSGGVCMLYEQRPIACREHIVTGTAEMCRQDKLSKPNVVPVRVSMVETLGEMASQIEGTEVEAIILPFTQAWVQDNLWRAERKWPAMEMVGIFTDILKRKANTANPQPQLVNSYA